MTTAIMSLTTARITAPVSLLSTIANLFRGARRFEQLFDMSDSQLAARGMTRDGLVRSYITGLGHN